MNSESTELLRGIVNLVVALITLGLGWFFGNKLAVEWNLIQKRRETDIDNTQQFYALYGEFKEVARIWRLIKREKDPNLKVPQDSRWSLLTRACALESKSEAIMVKLASERHLETDALRNLGLFRQVIQQLRESIRDDKEIPFGRRGSGYEYFNDLAASVGLIISSSRPDLTSDPQRASRRLEAIASVHSPALKAAVREYATQQALNRLKELPLVPENHLLAPHGSTWEEVYELLLVVKGKDPANMSRADHETAIAELARRASYYWENPGEVTTGRLPDPGKGMGEDTALSLLGLLADSKDFSTEWYRARCQEQGSTTQHKIKKK